MDETSTHSMEEVLGLAHRISQIGGTMQGGGGDADDAEQDNILESFSLEDMQDLLEAQESERMHEHEFEELESYDIQAVLFEQEGETEATDEVEVRQLVERIEGASIAETSPIQPIPLQVVKQETAVPMQGKSVKQTLLSSMFGFKRSM